MSSFIECSKEIQKSSQTCTQMDYTGIKGYSDAHPTYLLLWAIRQWQNSALCMTGFREIIMILFDCGDLTFEFWSNMANQRLHRRNKQKTNKKITPTAPYCQTKLSLAIKGFPVNSRPVYAHLAAFCLNIYGHFGKSAFMEGFLSSFCFMFSIVLNKTVIAYQNQIACLCSSWPI